MIPIVYAETMNVVPIAQQMNVEAERRQRAFREQKRLNV
jgi:hypothetical protein